MTIAGTFEVLTIVGRVLADIEAVDGAFSSASVFQIILSDFVSIAADGNRVASD